MKPGLDDIRNRWRWFFMHHYFPNALEGLFVIVLNTLAEKLLTIEQAILADISAELGEGFNRARFIPCVQMHEFEALLFRERTRLAVGLELPNDAAVQGIRDQFHSPEEINDSQQTAPSKRIMGPNPGYAKVLDGVRISQNIGLNVMRAQCPHFNEWIGKLEALAGR